MFLEGILKNNVGVAYKTHGIDNEKTEQYNCNWQNSLHIDS